MNLTIDHSQGVAIVRVQESRLMYPLLSEFANTITSLIGSGERKVLLDLFSEGERRGGAGGGVPTRLVRPLTPSLARSFREMALILPSGPATAAAAVAGRWEGSMQEAAAAPRRISVSLRLEGTRLSGTLTTRSRAVAMAVPQIPMK